MTCPTSHCIVHARIGTEFGARDCVIAFAIDPAEMKAEYLAGGQFDRAGARIAAESRSVVAERLHYLPEAGGAVRGIQQPRLQPLDPEYAVEQVVLDFAVGDPSHRGACRRTGRPGLRRDCAGRRPDSQ